MNRIKRFGLVCVVIFLFQGCATNEAQALNKKSVKSGMSSQKASIAYIFPSDRTSYAKSIPESYLVRTKSGCAFVNPNPVKNEHITWTGKCVDGFIDGYGELQWYHNGKKEGTAKKHMMYKGMYGLSKDNFSPKMPILKKSNTSGQCYFMLPSTYALSNSPIRKYFNLEFIGGCKNNQYTHVNVYFNNKLYAKYKGKIYGESLPIDGNLEMNNGNIYKVGSHNGDRYATSKTYQDWIDGLHLISKNSNSDLSVNDFRIKIGFNSTPTPVKEKNMNLLGFNIGSSTNTHNSIDIAYDIKPKNKLLLTHNRYLMKLEIKILYEEMTSMGYLGYSKNKIIYDYVTIELEKNKGYMSSGEKLLKNMNMYISGLGIKMVKSDFKPTVKVISIEGK